MTQQSHDSYNLFLSYGRKDDEAFVVKLYGNLTKYKYKVWYDKSGSLESNGISFLQNIRDAIAENPIRLILVIGPHAAKSEYVKAEYEFALENCITIIPVLRLGSTKDDTGKVIASDKDFDLLPEPIKKRNFDCIDFRNSQPYKTALGELLNDLSKEPRKLANMHGVINKPSNYIKRDEDIDKIKQSILKDAWAPTVVTSTAKSTAVQGMGGIGKSVIAAAVCYDCDIRKSFSDGIYWVTLGQQPNLQKAVSFITGENSINLLTDEGKNKLHEFLEKKNCLIILDDIWEQQHIEIFPGDRALRCRFLMTTRNKKTVKHISSAIIEIGLLSDDDALLLLATVCGKKKNELPPQGPLIIEQCGNLPLAISMIGGMIKAGDDNTWKYALQMMQASDLEEVGQQFPDYPYPNLYKAIAVSINDLDEKSRLKYLQLGIFKEDIRIPEHIIHLLWRSENWKEYHTHNFINELVERCVIQRIDTGVYTIHDLLLDYIRQTSVTLKDAHGQLLQNLGDPLKLEDAYSWNYYVWHLVEARQTEIAKKLLLDYEWIQLKLKQTDIYSLLYDIDQLTKAEPGFQRLNAALTSCQNIITEDPRQLKTQLIGRIDPGDDLLKTLIETAVKNKGPLYPRPIFKCFENKPYGSSDRSFNNLHNKFSLSADGSLLAMPTTADNIEFWVWKTGKLLVSFPFAASRILYLQFLHDPEDVLLVDTSGEAYILKWRDKILKRFSNYLFEDKMPTYTKEAGLFLSADRQFFFINIGVRICIYEMNSCKLVNIIDPGEYTIDNMYLPGIDNQLFFTTKKSRGNVYAWDWKLNKALNKLEGILGKDTAYLQLQLTKNNKLIIRHFSSNYICWDNNLDISPFNSWELEETSAEYLTIKDNEAFAKVRGSNFERFVVWNWTANTATGPDILKGDRFLPIHSFDMIAAIPENNIFFMRKDDNDGGLDVVDISETVFNYSLPGKGSRIKQLCVSKDNNYLLTGDDNGNIAIWDYKKREQICQYKFLEKEVEYLFFSKSGKYLFFSESISKEIRFIEFENFFLGNTEFHVIKLLNLTFEPTIIDLIDNDNYLFFKSETSLHVKAVEDLNNSAEENYSEIFEIRLITQANISISVAYGKAIFFNIETGAVLKSMTTGEPAVFTKDLQYMFMFQSGEVVVYDTGSLSKVKALPPGSQAGNTYVEKMHLSEDCSIVFLVYGRRVIGWRWQEGVLYFELILPEDIEGNIKYASLLLNNEYLLFSTTKEEILLWNISEEKYYSGRGSQFQKGPWGKELLPHSMNTKETGMILISKDANVIYTDFENTICCWDCLGIISAILADKYRVSYYSFEKQLQGHSGRDSTGGIGRMEFDENEDYLFSISDHGQIAIWDWNKKVLHSVKDFLLPKWSPNLICIAKDFIAIPESNYTIKFWRWKEDITYELKGHKNIIRQVLYYEEPGYLVSSASDKKIMIWKLDVSSEPVLLMIIALDDICLVALDPTKKILVANGMKGKIYSFKIEDELV